MPLGSGIAKGMGLTLSRLFSRSITIQYPSERYEVPEGSRGTLALTRHDDGRLKCRACFLCVKACPDGLIDIDTSDDSEGRTVIDSWRWESYACMLCSLCVEACPFDALHMDGEYEHASYAFDRLYKTLSAGEVADKPARKKKDEAEDAAGREAAAGDDAAGGGDAS